ncbi:hypothetical protein HMPREF0971_03063 [Segatella oris F0302]|uniref:Uncharacterized protein n=1 Tax=Segatella oris F0302 TaxID=649760 RepID=D1QVM4_9BACT|nr:hypothetical protein [Segatella oris]EFB30635.1 hypothetical protein HMPREF0971_03063 [Segatella oris F0302]MBF1449578.1 hypothetical protein [Segatella oris]
MVARAGLELAHEIGGAFGIQVLYLQQDRCYLPVPQGQHPPASQARREKGGKFRLKHKDTNPKPFSIDDRSALTNGQTGSDWEMDMNVGRKGRQGGSCNLSGKLFHAHGKTLFGKAGRSTGSCRRKDYSKGAGCL